MDGFYFLGETSDVQKNYPRGRVAEMKTAARSFMRRPKEHVADRLWKNKSFGKEKGIAKQTLE